MGKVIDIIYTITAQEEIFCQWYSQTVDNVLSAYNAGFVNLIKNSIPLDELTTRHRKNLSEAGNRALKKKEIKLRISQLTGDYAKKHKKAQLEEILSFLTSVMRKSKNEGLDNIFSIREALKAIEILIKHYPDFEKGAGTEDKYTFSRRRENK